MNALGMPSFKWSTGLDPGGCNEMGKCVESQRMVHIDPPGNGFLRYLCLEKQTKCDASVQYTLGSPLHHGTLFETWFPHRNLVRQWTD